MEILRQEEYLTSDDCNSPAEDTTSDKCSPSFSGKSCPPVGRVASYITSDDCNLPAKNHQTHLANVRHLLVEKNKFASLQPTATCQRNGGPLHMGWSSGGPSHLVRRSSLAWVLGWSTGPWVSVAGGGIFVLLGWCNIKRN